jgi:hypothetical protein
MLMEQVAGPVGAVIVIGIAAVDVPANCGFVLLRVHPPPLSVAETPVVVFAVARVTLTVAVPPEATVDGMPENAIVSGGVAGGAETGRENDEGEPTWAPALVPEMLMLHVAGPTGAVMVTGMAVVEVPEKDAVPGLSVHPPPLSVAETPVVVLAVARVTLTVAVPLEAMVVGMLSKASESGGGAVVTFRLNEAGAPATAGAVGTSVKSQDPAVDGARMVSGMGVEELPVKLNAPALGIAQPPEMTFKLPPTVAAPGLPRRIDTVVVPFV